MADQDLKSLTATTTPADGDLSYTVVDPAGTPLDRKITWTTVKAFLKTYFDTLYAVTGLAWTSMHTGTDGQIPTFDASGNPAFVATGNATQVLTSNGAGTAPTFQAVPPSTNFLLVQVFS